MLFDFDHVHATTAYGHKKIKYVNRYAPKFTQGLVNIFNIPTTWKDGDGIPIDENCLYNVMSFIHGNDYKAIMLTNKSMCSHLLYMPNLIRSFAYVHGCWHDTWVMYCALQNKLHQINNQMYQCREEKKKHELFMVDTVDDRYFDLEHHRTEVERCIYMSMGVLNSLNNHLANLPFTQRMVSRCLRHVNYLCKKKTRFKKMTATKDLSQLSETQRK